MASTGVTQKIDDQFYNRLHVIYLQDLATPWAFEDNPSLVWEFYHYRREVMLSKHPNAVSF
jgi:NAD-dependent SIR2 family protein deacetylase